MTAKEQVSKCPICGHDAFPSIGRTANKKVTQYYCSKCGGIFHEELVKQKECAGCKQNIYHNDCPNQYSATNQPLEQEIGVILEYIYVDRDMECKCEIGGKDRALKELVSLFNRRGK